MPSARLLATATIIIDDVFAINDIKIIRTNQKLCIAFPKESSAKKLGKETIAPLNVATRSYIENAVINKYKEFKEK